MSRAAAAAALGITTRTLARREDGQSRPKSLQLLEAAELFEVEIFFFFEGIEQSAG